MTTGFGGGRRIERKAVEPRMTDMPLRHHQWMDGKHVERNPVPFRSVNRVIVNAQGVVQSYAQSRSGDLQDVLDQFSDESVVMNLDRSAGDFEMNRNLSLYPGQILLGGGTVSLLSGQVYERPAIQMLSSSSESSRIIFANLSALIGIDLLESSEAYT